MSEQEFKEFSKKGLLILVDRTDKVFAELMDDMTDKGMVSLVMKSVDAYRTLLRKVIEENTK